MTSFNIPIVIKTPQYGVTITMFHCGDVLRVMSSVGFLPNVDVMSDGN